ncbi:plasminogen-like [Ruditapes philippinarum]|uniref:plasminogen-like n=1 Tax=Ruditapes philippinarum TaxID=129788 RepID=UPI00295A95C6|nr:plasminogen-like [Ruditapes philippinarum]
MQKTESVERNLTPIPRERLDIRSCSNNCGPLVDIAHGTVSAASTTHGSTATYACQYGYERTSGDITRNCVDGTWDGIEMTCTIKDCGGLPTISHGSVSVPYTTHGATATYSCDSKCSITSGHSSRTCDNGVWTGSAAVCTLIPHIGCYVGGQSSLYYGDTQSTVGNLNCQRWDVQSPHTHDMTATGLPEASLTDAKSFCRDPDLAGAPWCYTMDPNTRWDYCGVPLC